MARNELVVNASRDMCHVNASRDMITTCEIVWCEIINSGSKIGYQLKLRLS
jgi:hypothetical protein